MNTTAVPKLQAALFTRDSARRIDRVIDYFGENPPAIRARHNDGGERHAMTVES